ADAGTGVGSRHYRWRPVKEEWNILSEVLRFNRFAADVGERSGRFASSPRCADHHSFTHDGFGLQLNIKRFIQRYVDGFLKISIADISDDKGFLPGIDIVENEASLFIGSDEAAV